LQTYQQKKLSHGKSCVQGFQSVLNNNTIKKRPSFFIILSTNYHRINVSQFEFVELFLLSFTELQRRIGEIRTLYINCWARKKQ